jgi:sulfate/thiosulfate transport system ATP-binding protein
VTRIVHLGFEVRVELLVEGDERVSAQVARHEAEELGLAEGDAVWVRPFRTSPAPSALRSAPA